jgi:guanidinopropionase
MIDRAKLQALIEKYGTPADQPDAPGKRIVHDPEFKRVMDALPGTMPYASPATLLDAPYRPDLAAAGHFSVLDVALIGVPFDLGVTTRSGARAGPKAVRAIERVGPYEPVLRVAPFVDHRLADVGDVPFSSRFSLEQSHRDIEAFFRQIVAAGTVPLAVGGDHSVSHPILRAVGASRAVGMIHIDAHCDTSGALEGSRFHHGAPFRQAVLDGVLDPERSIQVGIRGSSEINAEFSYASGMTVIHAHEFARLGVAAVIEKARSVVGDGPTYLTFDIDSLDPAFAPGTGTPEVGGLTTREAVELLRGLTGLDIVGGDVVEVAPQYDHTTNTAHAACQMLFELLCLSVIALDRRRKRSHDLPIPSELVAQTSY